MASVSAMLIVNDLLVCIAMSVETLSCDSFTICCSNYASSPSLTALILAKNPHLFSKHISIFV